MAEEKTHHVSEKAASNMTANGSEPPSCEERLLNEAPAIRVVRRKARRADQGHLHASRHAVLSRFPLEALQRLGEDIKKYRRIERRFRETLKPEGEIGRFLFDRFISCYYRCVMAARVEANSISRTATSASPSAVMPSLHERDVPTLVLQDGERSDSINVIFPPDLFRELVLIQRYDRHFSREMFRALRLLLVLRDSGEEGLQQCIGHILGASKQQAGG